MIKDGNWHGHTAPGVTYARHRVSAEEEAPNPASQYGL